MARMRNSVVLSLAAMVASLSACSLPRQESEAARPQAILRTNATPGWGTTVDVLLANYEALFLFDTGGGITAVTPEAAKLIGCNPWGQMTGFRMGGERVDMKRCDNAHFKTGSLELTAPIAGVFDINAFAEGAATKLFGSLGLDVFAGRTITIRPAAHEIVVETPASQRERVRGAREITVRLVRDAEGVALSVNAAVSTPDGLAWMELDTGNSGSLAIGKHIAALLGLDPDGKGPQSVQMQLYGGVGVQGPARIGNFIMDGNIGAHFLNQWDLTLDLDSGKAWIRPASSAKTSP
jgi:hypothetical protein